MLTTKTKVLKLKAEPKNIGIRAHMSVRQPVRCRLMNSPFYPSCVMPSGSAFTNWRRNDSLITMAIQCFFLYRSWQCLLEKNALRWKFSLQTMAMFTWKKMPCVENFLYKPWQCLLEKNALRWKSADSLLCKSS